VVVQEIIVARFAIRVDPDALQIVQDRLDTGLACIRAVAVGAAAGHRARLEGRREAAVSAGAVAVLGVPIVGAGSRIRILDLMHDAGIGRAAENLNAVRRHRGVAVSVAEVDHVGMTEHDVVGTGAAVDGLVEVVAHRIFLRQRGEVRHVTLLHVVEAERRRTLARGRRRRRVFRGE
ncbi:hypothetical protein chiPu_0033451, partial [Chiloscyllium punctatum]|nr:hypothetical protein [Chiloscyllium punctatum]